MSNKRYEEILEQIEQKGVLEVLPKLSEAEAEAFLDIYHGNSPQDEQERENKEFDKQIVKAYETGILTEADDCFVLW
ncbi:MAG: hypothetical protein J5507_02930 [Clostridia bacterium]|nr:hypothetical protein [Clostridia bacterium]